MVTRVKVLCVPVYQRQWMWHAYSEGVPEPSTDQSALPLKNTPHSLPSRLNTKVFLHMQLSPSEAVSHYTGHSRELFGCTQGYELTRSIPLTECAVLKHMHEPVGLASSSQGGHLQTLDVQVSVFPSSRIFACLFFAVSTLSWKGLALLLLAETPVTGGYAVQQPFITTTIDYCTRALTVGNMPQGGTGRAF